MWTHVLGESLTGKPLMPVRASDARWRTGKVPTTGNTHVFNMGATQHAGLTEPMWADLTDSWSRYVVTCWNDVPQYAGIIIDSEVDYETGLVTTWSAELPRILVKRLASGQEPFDRDGHFEVAGLSARSAASAVIRHATQGAPGYQFPIVGFIAPQPGGVSRRWPYVEFARASDMLQELMNADGAPDVYLRPRWNSLHWLEWVLEVGSPKIGGPMVEWVIGAKDFPGRLPKVKRAGDKVDTGIIGVGQGTGRDTVLGFAGGLNTFPVRLDETRSWKSVSDAAQLDSLSMGELRTVEQPTRQISLTSARTSVLPTVRVGAGIRLLGKEGGFMGDSPRVLEVIGVSGGVGDTIGLETQ